MLTIYHPSFIETNIFSDPSINQSSLFLRIITNIVESVSLMLVLVCIIYIYNRLIENTKRSKYLILLFLLLPLLLPTIGSNPMIIHFLINLLYYGSLLFLIRYYWRFKPISFVLVIVIGVQALPEILNLLSKIHDPQYRIQIFLALFFITVFIIYYMRDLFTKKIITNE